jgi:hypothetical protein
MIYLVTVEFKRGPACGPMKISAPDQASAEWQARKEAVGLGFDEVVKKVTVRPE